ncbi:MAG: glycosyltransferase WbuB, partial [Rhodospirillales bacterium 12-71-4]
MRILYLHQHFSTPAGSTATRAFQHAAALAAAGHAVTLACGRYKGAVSGLDGPWRLGRRQGRVAGFEVVEYDIRCGNAQTLGARSLAFLRFAFAAARLALTRPWDLVI